MITIRNLRETQPDVKQSVELASFAFFDIETTGLHADRGARITEIAILQRGGERFVWSQDESKICDKNFVGQLPSIVQHLNSGVVVGHNVVFDLQFIAYEADRLGFRGPDVLFIDTLGLSKKLYNTQEDYQLSSLLKKFNISVEGKLHTAVVDARATQALFWKLINYGDIETLAQAGMQRLNWGTF